MSREPVHVTASIEVAPKPQGKDKDGGHISLKRVRGGDEIDISVYGPAHSMGVSHSVHVNPLELIRAIERLIKEDIG